VRELVRDCLGVAAGEPDEARLVRERAAALGVDAIALLDLLGLAGDAAPPAAEVGPVVASLVRALAANGPVVLLLDDVHWIDPASEAVLGAIAAATPGARLLVVTNFRPDYAGRWMDAPHVARLPLAPLAPDASQALLADLLGPDVSLAALVDVLGERTGGNPFFIEEVVQALASAGSLAGHPGAYRLAAPLDTLAIPETVHALLAARIDRLGSDAKHVLQVAAVIGKQFDRPLLDAVAGRETDAVGQALAGLAETGLVHDVGGDDGTRYAFRHPLTQEVAYHGQLGDRRALLHAAVASAIETLMAERLGEHAALIAHHWRAAGMRWEAERWTRRAALRVASIRLRGRGRMPAPRA
jgi:adenylate cyclase